MTLIIRRYLPDDRLAVRSLHDAALHAVDAHGGRGPWDDDLDDIPAVYLEPGGEFLVGCWEGQLVAMGGLRRIDDSSAEIKRMRVHPEFWRRGFALAILTQLESRARALGVTTVRLDTTERQTAAQALYRAHGYTEVDRHNVGQFRTIDFEKTLGGAAGA
jgi:GNAT superfamily N-acetyltransferase